MAQSIFNLRDFTAAISEAEARPNAEKVFNQLKGLAARGLLHPMPDRYGPKGALLFTSDQLFRARVLMAAIDMGVSSDNMAKLASDLDEKDRMQRAIADLSSAAPSHWLVEISWIRVPHEEGVGVYGNWLRDGRHRLRTGSDPLAADSYSASGVIEGVQYIRFTSLCLPLLKQLDAMEV